MKKFILPILSIGLFIIGCSNKNAADNAAEQAKKAEEGGYQISGNITGLPDGKVYIYANQKPFDSADVKTGAFTMAGKVAEDMPVLLVSKELKGITPFFLENTKMEIKGAVTDPQNIKTTGGQGQTDFNTYVSAINPTEMSLQAFDNEYKEALMTNNVAKKAEIEEKMKPMLQKREGIIKDFIKSHSKSKVSVFVFQGLFNNPQPNMAEIKATFQTLDKSLQESAIGMQISAFMAQKEQEASAPQPASLKVGQMAPDFTQNDANDKPVSLSSFRGKYVLVDFWASWCGPCRRENPNVIAAYNQFKNKNFEILGVSLDDNKESWLQAIQADGLPWKHVSDLKKWSNEAARIYGVQGIPFNVLVDPKGKIVAQNLRGEELAAKLKQVLR